MSRLTSSIFLLFSLSLGFYVAVWLVPSTSLPTETESTLLTPDYTATDIDTFVYSQQGKLAHHVSARAAEHYTELDTILFQGPSFSFYPEQGGPWLMSATEGSLSGDNIVQLERSVVVTTPAADEFVQRIHTDFLAFDLTEQVALSDKNVTIEGADFVISSQGLRANFHSRQFELSHHVQTRYFPPIQ